MEVQQDGKGRGLTTALRRWRPFARSERGAVAIEFALLAVPFFALVGAILETAVVFLATAALDSAVDRASRLLRTGQAQTAGFDLDAFKAEVCDGMYGLISGSQCGALVIRVTKITSFSSASLAPPLDDDGTFVIGETFNGGAGGDIILVETYYKWPTLLDLGGFNLANTGDGKRLLAAVRLFKNEPFS